MKESLFISMTNVDGNIRPTDQACIPVLDRGFLYGDSVYEVFRTYSGIPLFYDEHWDRLENSARLIRMQLTQNRAEITEEIRRTVAATNAGTLGQDVYVRYAVTRGEGPVELYASPEARTRYVIIVRELPSWNPIHYERGMKAAIPEVRRNPVNALDPNIKGGNYLNNVMAVTQARELGADESIILNHDDMVTEASNSNVFFVLDNRLCTPGDEAGNLKGLTKQALGEACTAHQLDIDERAIHVSELRHAKECFVTSATREVMPVASLRLEDASLIEFPAGGGPLTRRVAGYYKEYLDTYVQTHRHLTMW